MSYFIDVVSLPNLSERFIDIPYLVENILETQSWICGRPLRVTNEAMDLLTNYNYKDNITELENILEKAAIRTSSSLIQATDLELRSRAQLLNDISTLAEMERLLIFQTLKITGNNKTHAAKKLGISIRTLRNKLSHYREEETHESNVR
jgi:DNA-binding NtrC family response regulator